MNVFAHDLNNSTLVLRVILTVCLNSTTLVLSPWWTSMPLLSAERYMCVLDNRGELTTCNNWDRKLGEPNVDGAAERFKAFFADNRSEIRTQLAFARTQCPFSLSLNVHACDVTEPLFDFQPASVDDICRLLMKSSYKVVPVIDTITGPLLKYNVNTLAPVLTRIVNSSIETSLVPCVMKHAVVTPLLKTPGLDPENMMNYRPISNLSFVSKLLEKHMATQVRQHLEVNALFDVFQSAYSPAHSCETALGTTFCSHWTQ